jgi:hypothetical protein
MREFGNDTSQISSRNSSLSNRYVNLADKGAIMPE